jgi:hypothetical protein
MNGDDLVIVVPLWRRTVNIARCYESAYQATPGARVLFVASAGDQPVVDFLNDAELDHMVMPGDGGGTGDYARKINAGYRGSREPHIFTGADDIVFTLGWYQAAVGLLDYDPASWTGEQTVMHGPASDHQFVGVVGTNDGCNPRTFDMLNPAYPHSTHSLVARWYADAGATMTDGPNVVYHEGYEHEYCDDELVQTALLRCAYAHAQEAHVTHLHPNAGAAPDDETYQRGRSRTRVSRNHYRRRQALWGGRR